MITYYLVDADWGSGNKAGIKQCFCDYEAEHSRVGVGGSKT